jgi:hypothetical protein
MVRRGSTVRVRQRALQKRRKSGLSARLKLQEVQFAVVVERFVELPGPERAVVVGSRRRRAGGEAELLGAAPMWQACRRGTRRRRQPVPTLPCGSQNSWRASRNCDLQERRYLAPRRYRRIQGELVRLGIRARREHRLDDSKRGGDRAGTQTARPKLDRVPTGAGRASSSATSSRSRRSSSSASRSSSSSGSRPVASTSPVRRCDLLGRLIHQYQLAA